MTLIRAKAHAHRLNSTITDYYLASSGLCCEIISDLCFLLTSLFRRSIPTKQNLGLIFRSRNLTLGKQPFIIIWFF
jgi:hypothetical protein